MKTHIFIVVRRSARNLGVLRESKLAKRISAIVHSSFVFFAAPNFALKYCIFQLRALCVRARTMHGLEMHLMFCYNEFWMYAA